MKHKDYVRIRVQRDRAFAAGYDAGYAVIELSALVRQARAEAGLTQAEVAAQAGVTLFFLSIVENKGRRIDDERVIRICQVLRPQLSKYGIVVGDVPNSHQSVEARLSGLPRLLPVERRNRSFPEVQKKSGPSVE